MKRIAFSRPAIPFAWQSLSALSLVLLLQITGGHARAQDEPAEPSRPSADSQAVDEEEAEFRRRMELEERSGEDHSSPAVLPDIVEVDPAEAPEDRLPPSSREHLEEQLTELIIENGRWEPADEQRDVPFEPSVAARSDPQLAAEEAEAWQAMVDAYHERERAAWSGAPGNPGAGDGPDGASAPGQGGAAGSGQGSGSGQAPGSDSGSGSGSGRAGQPGGAATDGGERPASGNPFSALEFLGGAAGEAAEGEAPATTGAAVESDPDAQDDATGEPVAGPRVSGASSPESAAETPGATDPAESAESAGVAANPAPTDGAPSTSASPPGAIDPAALEVLFSGQPADGDADADADADADTDAGADSVGSADARRPGDGSRSSSDASPPESPPPAGPPPEPSLWDWLLGLFGSDPESGPGADDRSG